MRVRRGVRGWDFWRCSHGGFWTESSLHLTLTPHLHQKQRETLNFQFFSQCSEPWIRIFSGRYKIGWRSERSEIVLWNFFLQGTRMMETSGEGVSDFNQILSFCWRNEKQAWLGRWDFTPQNSNQDFSVWKGRWRTGQSQKCPPCPEKERGCPFFWWINSIKLVNYVWFEFLGGEVYWFVHVGYNGWWSPIVSSLLPSLLLPEMKCAHCRCSKYEPHVSGKRNLNTGETKEHKRWKQEGLNALIDENNNHEHYDV